MLKRTVPSLSRWSLGGASPRTPEFSLCLCRGNQECVCLSHRGSENSHKEVFINPLNKNKNRVIWQQDFLPSFKEEMGGHESDAGRLWQFQKARGGYCSRGPGRADENPQPCQCLWCRVQVRTEALFNW